MVATNRCSRGAPACAGLHRGPMARALASRMPITRMPTIGAAVGLSLAGQKSPMPLLCAFSRLQLFCLLLLHQHTVRDGLEAQVRWRSAGFVPVLLATAHEL